MSNAKALRFLAAALAVLVAAHVFLSFRGVPVVFSPRQTLVDLSVQDGVGRIEIERPGSAPVVLERTDCWRVAAPFSGLADEGAVRRLLDALSMERIVHAYTEEDLVRFAKTREDYDSGNPAVTVRLFAADTSVVRLGRRTPVGDGVFAFIDGDPRIYVVGTNLLAAVDRPTGEFRPGELCPDVLDSVAAFDIKRGLGSFRSYARGPDGAWALQPTEKDGAPVPASTVRIRQFFSDLSKARISGYVWPVGAADEPRVASASLVAGYGLDPESAVTVALRNPDRRDGRGETLISFGKEASDGRVYALVQNRGAIVTVDGAVKDALAGTDFTDSRLFPFERADVTRVSVTDGDGVCYLLARGADGAWRLDAPVAAPADSQCAEALLTRLLALTTRDRAESGVVLSLSTNAPPETVEPSAVLGSVSLADLRSREVLRIAPADVRRISVTGPGAAKPTAVVFNKDLRCWTLESSGAGDAAAADEESVARLLFALNPLTAASIVKLKVTDADLGQYDLKTPRWTIAVDSARGEEWRRNILVGGRAPGGYFATLGASDAVFVLPEKAVEALTAPLVR